ncbi:MAG TPA: hypothetical protein DEA08_16570 [Planctomycetes bacterium]|nr:hypothetical protein [Planctomycetota bacterium]
MRALAVVGLLAGGALLGALYERVEQVQREAERANAAIDRIEAGFSASESAQTWDWPAFLTAPEQSVVAPAQLEPAPPEPRPIHHVRGAGEGEWMTLRAGLRQFEGRVVFDVAGEARGYPDGTRLEVVLAGEHGAEASLFRVRVDDERFSASQTLQGRELVPQRYRVKLRLDLGQQRKPIMNHLRREFGLPRDAKLLLLSAALSFGDEGRQRAAKLEARKELLRVTQDLLAVWPEEDAEPSAFVEFKQVLERAAEGQPRYLLDLVEEERASLQQAILEARFGVRDRVLLGPTGSARLKSARLRINDLMFSLLVIGSGC